MLYTSLIIIVVLFIYLDVFSYIIKKWYNLIKSVTLLFKKL